MCLYYGLGNREAQPCAFLLARPGFVYAVEALEDVWQVLFRNAGTAVFDPDKQLTGLVVAERVTRSPARLYLAALSTRMERPVLSLQGPP